MLFLIALRMVFPTGLKRNHRRHATVTNAKTARIRGPEFEQIFNGIDFQGDRDLRA